MEDKDWQTIYIWPDGGWCTPQQLPGLPAQSEDYVIHEIPLSFEIPEIEEYVRKVKRGSCPTCEE